MENTLHILILEDNPADAEIIQFELQDAGISFTAKLVTAQKDFVHELQKSCPDLILSDYDLPQFNGAEALKLANKHCPNVPFILVTGAVSEERAIEILTGGATDYVLKHRLARLVPAVKRALAEADEIKARQAAEEALKKSERLVREQLEEIQSIYNSAPVGLCVLDRELRFVRVNQRLAEINGVPAAEHIGRTLQEIVHDLSSAAEETAAMIFQSGEPVLNIELTGTTSAQPGVRRTWRESWLPLKDGGGHVIGINVVVAEITKYKKLEDDLRKSYSVYNRSLIEASLDPLVTIDAGGKITDVNAAAELATGYSRDELIGTDFSDYFTDPENARAGYRQVFKNGFVRDYALDIRHKDGHTTPVLYNASIYKDQADNVIGIFAAARDITERKCVQDKLQKLLADHEMIGKELWATNKSLQKEISERKLVEEELRKRKSQLEAVNKELESFSYSVSHDLRSPLRAIDGFARMLLRDAQDKLDEEALHRLDVIRCNSGKMNQLIDDILAFSRMSSQTMVMDVIEMDNLAAVVWNELLAINEQRNITMNISPLPAAYGDQKLVRQVLVNLLDNAVKYTKNKAQAAIEVGSCEEAGETVYYVRDNGIGFDMKHYNKLFGIFQRLHRDEEYDGTGVGLSIIKRIVQRHGGRVWGEGKVNSGAIFYFSLPGKGRRND